MFLLWMSSLVTTKLGPESSQLMKEDMELDQPRSMSPSETREPVCPPLMRMAKGVFIEGILCVQDVASLAEQLV